VKPTVSTVYLKDQSNASLIEAALFDCILPKHLDDFERLWTTYTCVQKEQHGHWNWRLKMSRCSGQLSYRSFAIECSGETQGLMIVNTIHRCKLPQQSNKHLVYVEYLEAAPWNRPSVTQIPKYKGIGTALIAAAIQLSIDEGNQGRIGLHSLSQADTFYRDACGMSDLGPDLEYPKHPLRYFEMNEMEAEAFMQE
jgi:hypothetical protein